MKLKNTRSDSIETIRAYYENQDGVAAWFEPAAMKFFRTRFVIPKPFGPWTLKPPEKYFRGVN